MRESIQAGNDIPNSPCTFDNDPSNRVNQDVGLDGLKSIEEIDKTDYQALETVIKAVKFV